MGESVSPTEPRFHTQRPGRLDLPLPVPSSLEHTAFVAGTYAKARSRSSGAASPNPYALLPDTLAFLELLLDEVSPKLVVEFGSGESTQIFSRWLAPRGGQLVSVEHDRGWVAEMTRRLDAATRDSVRIIHAPLRLARRGLRSFLSYRGLDGLTSEVARAQLLLLDGPHMSGRELVLYFVLAHCAPGAIIVVDDFRHYAVRDMVLGVPEPLARCFVGAAIDENAHGLYVLRCTRPPVPADVRSLGLRAVARSYWRCLRDYKQHGTGD